MPERINKEEWIFIERESGIELVGAIGGHCKPHLVPLGSDAVTFVSNHISDVINRLVGSSDMQEALGGALWL